MHTQSTERSAPVTTTPAPELPGGVADLDQARQKRKRRKLQTVPPNTGHGLSRYAYLESILGDRNLTRSEQNVLIALWKRTQEQDAALYAWPSAATLAADVGLKWERDVRRHLANLRAKGYLQDMGPGTWAHLAPRANGHDMTTLHILALPHVTAGAAPEAEGMGTAPRGGMGTAPRGGVGTAPIQTTKGTNHSTTKENPVAATAPPPAVSGVGDNSIRYGRDGYDADGKPWESTVKAAFIEWANTTTDTTAAAAREKVLALIAARNGQEAADWARDFWSWGESRALAIAMAPSLADAQYEAGALYARMLNAAAADYMHPVIVVNPPREHHQAPVAAVDRDAEALAQLDAEAEAAAARGDLLPEFAEFYARREHAAPLSPQPSPAPSSEDDDVAAELERVAQAQRDLAARVAAQEAEDRRQQARARLDARYEAEARAAELEDADTVTPQDRAEAVAMFAAVPPSPDDFTVPAPVPELEDFTEPDPADRAEFIRLFLVPDTDHHAQARHQAPTRGTPWAVRKVPA